MTPEEPCNASNGVDMALSISSFCVYSCYARLPGPWKAPILAHDITYSSSFLRAALYCVRMSNFAVLERPGLLSISFN